MKRPIVFSADFGGSKEVRYNLFDSRPLTDEPLGKKEACESVDEIMEFIKKASMNADVIGLSVCGTVKNNIIISSPNLKAIEGVDIGKVIGKPTLVYNDIHAMAAGIQILMPTIKNNFFALTLSSGIGGKPVVDGKILEDVEPGHIVIDSSPNAPRCGCKSRGCLEAICGGNNAIGAIINMAESYNIKLDSGINPWKQLDEARERNEDWAIDFYDYYSDNLGRGFKIMRSIVPINYFVLKGSIAKYAFKKWIEPGVRYALRRYGMNPHWEREMKFELSIDLDYDAVLGAARLAGNAYIDGNT